MLHIESFMFLLFAKHVGDEATFPFGHNSVMKSIRVLTNFSQQAMPVTGGIGKKKGNTSNHCKFTDEEG